MPKRTLPVLCSLVALAAGPGIARADSVRAAPCTTDSVSLAQYGPCTFGGVVFSDFSAMIGDIDLTAGGQVGATSTIDQPVPHVPVLSIPQPHFLPAPVSPDTPLDYEFTATAIAGTLTGVRLTIHEHGNFTGLVTLRVQTPDGQVFTVPLGTDGEPLGSSAFVPLASVRAVRLKASITQAASLGGGIGFVFGVDSSPAPVPEPGAILLAGTGLAWLARRRRAAARRN